MEVVSATVLVVLLIFKAMDVYCKKKINDIEKEESELLLFPCHALV